MYEKIVKSWGIECALDDIGLAEHLIETQKSNCFFIDRVPLTVSRENAKKFGQFEICFQEVLNRRVCKDKFLQIETKFRNVIFQLWLYNKFYVELDADTAVKKRMKATIDPQYRKFLTNMREAVQAKEITESEELAFWVQAGIRDATFPTFYLEDYQLLLMPSGTCWFAYLHDPTKLQIIKDIVMSEGLFVRLCAAKNDN